MTTSGVARSITVKKMSTIEFDNYAGNDTYAQEISKSKRISIEEAMVEAKSQLLEVLPEGVDTKNHYLFTITESKSGKHIGMFWFELQPLGQDKLKAFAYDIFVNESFRCKGYGSQIMNFFEKTAKDYGASILEAHVFHQNVVSVNMCKKMKFKVTKSGKKSAMWSKTLIKG